ncbi:MAG: GAF and ANTAR domain-containing protein [Gaiellales bacterium]
MSDYAPTAAEMQLDRLLNALMVTAVETLGFDAATISARHDDALTTIAATNQQWIALDETQYHAGDGPCVTVLDQHDPILLEDISTENRWPEFKETAEHFGINSSLSVHIPTGDLDDVQASLNLYARQTPKPAEPGASTAEAFADQIAIAMQAVEAHRTTAKLAAGLQEAIQSRAVIEQAKGILIAQHGGSPDDAFERLRELSQHSNIKLRDVARRIVEEHSARTNNKANPKDIHQ